MRFDFITVAWRFSTLTVTEGMHRKPLYWDIMQLKKLLVSSHI
jgi:hypothetical protein